MGDDAKKTWGDVDRWLAVVMDVDTGPTQTNPNQTGPGQSRHINHRCNHTTTTMQPYIIITHEPTGTYHYSTQAPYSMYSITPCSIPRYLLPLYYLLHDHFGRIGPCLQACDKAPPSYVSSPRAVGCPTLDDYDLFTFGLSCHYLT